MAYPNSYDAFPANHVDPPAPGSPEKIASAIVNKIEVALNAMQQEYGLNPSDIWPDVATRMALLEFLNPNVVTATTYTINSADQTKGIVCTASGGCAITVPASTTWNAPNGTIVPVRAGASAGAVTVAGAAGVVIRNPYTLFGLAGQCAQAQLLKIGTDVWSWNGEVA